MYHEIINIVVNINNVFQQTVNNSADLLAARSLVNTNLRLRSKFARKNEKQSYILQLFKLINEIFKIKLIRPVIQTQSKLTSFSLRL